MISDLEIAEAEAGSNDPFFTSPWYSGENTWHPPYWLKNEASLTMKYIHSFFWGAGMVTSLVPRDIEPLTVMESIITTTTMFFGLLLNAFVISSLNQALASMNSKQELTGKQMGEIKNYLILKEIPPKLRSRILEYYEYLLGSSAALEGLNMFENLPPALSAQLALSTNRRLVGKCAFFHSISNSSMITLIEELKALVFIPSQMIARQGSLVKAVYFINRGIVKIFTHDSAQPTLTNTDNFGLEDYFAGCVAKSKPQVSATSQAVTYCDLMSLGLESLEKALSKDKRFRDGIEEAQRNARAAHKAAHFAQQRNLAANEPRGRGTFASKRGVKGRFNFPTMSDLKYLKSRAATGGSARSPPPIPEKERERRALVNLAKKINAQEAEALEQNLEQNTGTGESSGSSDGRGRAYGNGRLSPSKRSSLRAALLRAAARLMAGEDLRSSPPPIDDHLRRTPSLTPPSLARGIRGAGDDGSNGGGGSSGGSGGGGGDGGNGGSGDGGSGDAASVIATAALSDALAGNGTAGASPVAIVAEPPSASGGGRGVGKLYHPHAQRTPTVPSLRSRDEDYAADMLASARHSVTGDGSARSGDGSARSRPGKLSARGGALSAFETARDQRSSGDLPCRTPTAFAPTSPATATAALPGCEDASSSTRRHQKSLAVRWPPRGYGDGENTTGGGTGAGTGTGTGLLRPDEEIELARKGATGGTAPTEGGGGSSGGSAGLQYLPRLAIQSPAASAVRSPSAFACSSISAWEA